MVSKRKKNWTRRCLRKTKSENKTKRKTLKTGFLTNLIETKIQKGGFKKMFEPLIEIDPQNTLNVK